MELESVNVGAHGLLAVGKARVKTGFGKLAVPRAWIDASGVAGDTIVNRKHHGGPDQAVYVYSREDYRFWEGQLERPLAPGTFGENLVLERFGDAPLRIGSRIRVGQALLEVTAPRIPCQVFESRIGVRGWVRQFRRAERPGAHTRVLEAGWVAPGDPVAILPPAQPYVTLVEAFRLYYDRGADVATLRAALRAPVSERLRAALERALERRLAPRLPEWLNDQLVDAQRRIRAPRGTAAAGLSRIDPLVDSPPL